MGIRAVGDEIRYFEWNGLDDWDEHFAIVRTAPASPASPLSLFFGTAGNVVLNVESLDNWDTLQDAEGNDYWLVRTPFPYHLVNYPIETVEVFIGSIITIRKWNASISEFDIYNAVVQAIVGAPGQDHPTVNLAYFDSTGRNRQNQVVPAEDLIRDSGPGGYESTDHWLNHPLHAA